MIQHLFVCLSDILIVVLLVSSKLVWLSSEIFAAFLQEFLTLGLDAVFSIIYIAVMLIYSGVLTAVTLGVIPLFIALTYCIAS